ncbi:MAG TPA: cell wall-binding repeat-containing protein, partial [Coriobacteriia bacterium]|nr:cell wall-binding repeat-containing protein [Coriobacteriia bacterium]
TSIECAKFGVSHGLWWDGVAISTGANFPDALAAGMLQGQAGSVLLLTPSDALHSSVAAELTAQRDWIGNVTFLGGTAAVSQDVRDAVAAILK